MVRLRLRTRSDLQSSKNWQGGLTYKKQEKGPRRALMTSPQCACLGTSLVSHWLSSGTPRLSKLLLNSADQDCKLQVSVGSVN